MTPPGAGINRERIVRDVVGIGASAGGVKALNRLFAQLPEGFPGVILGVLHRSPFHIDSLPSVLGRSVALPIREPEDDERLVAGTIYIAPRDRHLLVSDGVVRLSGGPREHYSRPAVDPLLRALAATYRARVVGVILTGSGADGVSGLVDVKSTGGLALVQDPREAERKSMPLESIRQDDVDAVLSLESMGRVLSALARGEPIALGGNGESNRSGSVRSADSPRQP